MMGEIPDEESVEALMRLSSSGHRAISTLHTNSACELPNRLFLLRAATRVKGGERNYTINLGGVTITGNATEKDGERVAHRIAQTLTERLRAEEKEDYRTAIA